MGHLGGDGDIGGASVVKVDDDILDLNEEVRVMGITDKGEVYWCEIGTDEVWPNEEMRSRGMTGRDFEDINLALEIPGGEVGGLSTMTDRILELSRAREAVAQRVELYASPGEDVADGPEQKQRDEHAEPEENQGGIRFAREARPLPVRCVFVCLCGVAITHSEE
jgi:hypothetical protein